MPRVDDNRGQKILDDGLAKPMPAPTTEPTVRIVVPVATPAHDITPNPRGARR